MTGEEIECAAESMTRSGGDFLKLELRDDSVETSWCSHAGSDGSENRVRKGCGTQQKRQVEQQSETCKQEGDALLQWWQTVFDQKSGKVAGGHGHSVNPTC